MPTFSAHRPASASPKEEEEEEEEEWRQKPVCLTFNVTYHDFTPYFT